MKNFAWLSLFIAIILEASWVIGLRFTGGFTKFPMSILVFLVYLLGIVPLSYTIRTITPSLAYAIWVGGGIVIVTLFDAFYFKEGLPFIKIFCIFLILSGSVGLKLLSSHS